MLIKKLSNSRFIKKSKAISPVMGIIS